MKKFNVGIQLYGVRNSMAMDFEGTVKAIAEMGYAEGRKAERKSARSRI